MQTQNDNIQLYQPQFSAYIAKIRKRLVWGTSDQLVNNFDFYLHAKNKFLQSFLSRHIKFQGILSLIG